MVGVGLEYSAHPQLVAARRHKAEARLVQNRQRLRQPAATPLGQMTAPYATPAQKQKLYPWTKVGGLDVPLEYIIP